MTGVLLTKTSSINSRSVRKQTWTSSWLSNVQKSSRHAGLARSGIFSSTSRLGHPQSGKESSSSRAQNLRHRPVEYKIFRALCRLHGIGCSSEEIRPERQAATDMTAAKRIPRRAHLLAGRCRPRVCATTGFPGRLERLQTRISKRQAKTLDLTSARRKRLANELDVSTCGGAIESTKAVVPTLLSGIDVSIHSLECSARRRNPGRLQRTQRTNPFPSAGRSRFVAFRSPKRRDIRRSVSALASPRRQPDR